MVQWSEIRNIPITVLLVTQVMGLVFNDVNDDIITNVAITNPQSIQFQLASSSTSANKTISIEYATSATGPWTTVRNILNSEVSTSFTLFTTNLNLTGAYYLRIVMSLRTGGSIIWIM